MFDPSDTSTFLQRKTGSSPWIAIGLVIAVLLIDAVSVGFLRPFWRRLADPGFIALLALAMLAAALASVALRPRWLAWGRRTLRGRTHRIASAALLCWLTVIGVNRVISDNAQVDSRALGVRKSLVDLAERISEGKPTPATIEDWIRNVEWSTGPVNYVVRTDREDDTTWVLIAKPDRRFTRRHGLFTGLLLFDFRRVEWPAYVVDSETCHAIRLDARH